MCLFSKEKKGLIAETDIECYKCLMLEEDGTMTTPYTETPVDSDTLCGRKPMVAKGKEDVSEGYYNYSMGYVHNVGSGFIHTYETVKAMDYMRNYEGVTFYRCIIPKGTRYYRGLNLGYASKKIMFVEKLRQ